MKLRFGVTAAEKKAWIVFLVLLGLTAGVLVISAGLDKGLFLPGCRKNILWCRFKAG